MYIITNSTLCGDYTPSTADTLEEARAWMQECTAENIRSSLEGDLCCGMTDAEIIAWAKDNLEYFEFDEMHSYIQYNDDSYNLMHIYNVDDL